MREFKSERAYLVQKYNIKVMGKTKKMLSGVDYSQITDSLDGPEEFPFGPLSIPEEEYLHLPPTCEVH